MRGEMVAAPMWWWYLAPLDGALGLGRRVLLFGGLLLLGLLFS